MRIKNNRHGYFGDVRSRACYVIVSMCTAHCMAVMLVMISKLIAKIYVLTYCAKLYNVQVIRIETVFVVVYDIVYPVLHVNIILMLLFNIVFCLYTK